jgi:NCS1 family nucleobase:cation symporter-1
METIRNARDKITESVRGKHRLSGWVLPKQQTSFAPEGTWTNIDLDVTPVERRVWTVPSILGYWLSDVVRFWKCDRPFDKNILT